MLLQSASELVTLLNIFEKYLWLCYSRDMENPTPTLRSKTFEILHQKWVKYFGSIVFLIWFPIFSIQTLPSLFPSIYEERLSFLGLTIDFDIFSSILIGILVFTQIYFIIRSFFREHPYLFSKKQRGDFPKKVPYNGIQSIIEILPVFENGILKNLTMELLEMRNTDPSNYNLSEEQESSFFQYIWSKYEFLETKEKLLLLFATDIKKDDISPSETLVIKECIDLYTKNLRDLTDSLIEIMPDEISGCDVYPDSTLFREMLFEENSWLEWEANSMHVILSEWIGVHLEEVETEQEKLKNILKENYLSPLAEIIEISGTLIRQNIERIRVPV